MATTSFADGTLRVRYPPGYRATPVTSSHDRRLDRRPGVPLDVTPDLLETLQGNGFDQVAGLDLTPEPTRSPPGAAQRTSAVTMEVDLPAAQDAVVLVDEGGCYSWHLPLGSGAGGAQDRDLRQAPHTARFDIGVRRASSKARAAGAGRGLFGGVVTGAVRAYVLSFAAPLLGDVTIGGAAIGLLESLVRPGLVRVTSPDVATWPPCESLADVGLPTDRPTRVLLFVHGTFDSTVGAFGGLGVSQAGRAFLRRAVHDYDAVVGFDHRTLSVDPLANAADLLRRLAAFHSTKPVTVDIVCHSRGGLTTRSLVDEVLPEGSWRGRVDRVVFVAATNAGTHFADASRWGDLVDLYTNLVAARARRLAGVPGAGPVVAVTGAALRGLGMLVRYLASYATASGDVPGLSAMAPGGAFVTHLDADQPGQPRPGTPWFVVSSNFHAVVRGDLVEPAELPLTLAARLAEGVVDEIFHGDNDLVVDVASMGAIDVSHGGGYVRDSLALGTNAVVHHLSYFEQETVANALSVWLLDRRDRLEPTDRKPGGGTTSRAVPPPPAPAEGHTSRGMTPAGEDSGPAPGVDSVPEPTRAFLAAELPQRPDVGVASTLRVRLSRKEIEAAAGMAQGRASFLVVAERPLSVQVVPTRNVRVDGPDSDVFALPVGGGTSELSFAVTPLDVGPVAVTVVVRQGTVPLGSVVVTADAVDPGVAPRAANPSVASVGVGLDAPELETVSRLEIFETERRGKTVYVYTLRLPALGICERYESPPLGDREGFVAAIFSQVEQGWAENADRPKAFLSQLQDVGASLFEQLFPQELQGLLWRHRAELDNLMVFADEPFIPWELVHLKPPVGPRQKRPDFLGQRGLVRWQFVGFPGTTLRARPGRVRSLCPSYLDPAYVLTQTAAEERFLTDRLAATPVGPGADDVRTLLRSGDFDLLHFAGHGQAKGSDITTASILLAGRKRGTTIVPQLLTATAVAENARLRGPDGTGPLVVLNACQVGRGGQQLSTLGGFARAFLAAGASAFVSSLWSVGDEPARAFVESFYEELLGGATVAAAAVRAREKARASGDATWLAYVVFARPDAVLVRD